MPPLSAQGRDITWRSSSKYSGASAGHPAQFLHTANKDPVHRIICVEYFNLRRIKPIFDA